MQNANEIRHHIAAVEQTRKITNAMHLISTARMRKAMKRIEYDHVYFSRVQAAMKDILLSPHPVTSPYLNRRAQGKRLYIVVAGDKGMAGAYNTTVLDFAYRELSALPRDDYELYTVGLVAGTYFRNKGLSPDREVFGLSQNPTMHDARDLVLDLMDQYDNETLRSVYVVYTQHTETIQGVPVTRRILPIRIHDYEDVAPTETVHDMLYLPSHDEVFQLLIPWYLVGLLYGALVQAYASEHLARMNAMQSATRNADELLKKLRLQYNIARQAAITQEISEITGAAAAILEEQEG